MAKEKAKDNMELYNMFREVPNEALKDFKNGKFSGSDINPMWRIRRLTEVFGACGTGWKWGKPEFTVEVDGTTKTVHCTVALYYKQENGEWSEPVWGVGGNTIAQTYKDGRFDVSDEGYKMAFTDACGNAAKSLGVGADVWFAKDVTKYTAKQSEAKQTEVKAEKPKEVDMPSLLKSIEDCKSAGEVEKIWRANPALQGNLEFKAKIIEIGKKLKAA